MMQPEVLSLYLVADPDACPGDFLESIAGAIRGGVTCVQLRAKSITDRDLIYLARDVQRLCRTANCPFLINDRIDIALAVGADGVHLGVDDLPLEDARALAPEGFIIGYSPETDEQIEAAVKRGADYLGIGPVFGTTSKSDAGAALGTEEFARRCRLTAAPVVGIGGITAQNAREVVSTGAAGVAVVSAILAAPDANEAARSIRVQSGM